jgi:indolepyruvate ferredoxin oxidoreductase alpha subunit
MKEKEESVALYPEVYAEWAPNEKVAMESAFGAALSGVRSFCGMKHVGLNVAADPLFTISYTGINAGMVIAVADDPGMHSSQNEQDSRHYAKAAKLPMLEPADSAEAKDYAILAYELSEKFDTPVMLRMCTRVSHSRSLIELAPRKELEPKAYEKTPSKYIMMPANAKRRHPIVEERTAALSDWASESGINKAEEGKDSSRGIICTVQSTSMLRKLSEINIPFSSSAWLTPAREAYKELCRKGRRAYRN